MVVSYQLRPISITAIPRVLSRQIPPRLAPVPLPPPAGGAPRNYARRGAPAAAPPGAGGNQHRGVPQKPPFFSIIIPARNEEKVIGSLLQDIQRQQYQNHETIVVAHYCTDATQDIARAAGARTVALQQGNVSDARNYGARYSRGRVLLFIDADTRLPDYHFLTNIAAAFSKLTNPLILTGKVLPQDNHPIARLICLVKNVSVGWGLIKTANGYLAISRSIWPATGGFQTTKVPLELIDLTRAARRAGARFIFLPAAAILFSFRRYHHNGYLKTLALWLGLTSWRLVSHRTITYLPATSLLRKNSGPSPKKQVRR